MQRMSQASEVQLVPRPLQLPDEATSDAIVTRVSPQGPHKPASPPLEALTKLRTRRERSTRAV